MTVNQSSLGAVLITGAGRRIGRSLALDLARRGHPVAVHYNGSHQAAAETVNEILASGGMAVAVPADLANETDVDTLVERTRSAAGPISVLINNASVFEHDTIETVTKASWEMHLGVNVWAPLRLSQRFAAQLDGDADGNVINILDQRVWNLTPVFTSYTVSKTALWTLTQTLALALAPNIRVNGIGPGPTLPSPRQTEDHFIAQWSGTPLARPVDPDDICRAARFILDAPSLTGQMIALDSGQHLGTGGQTAGDVE
jgi:NAD(P)-dependent dehydrogenase (short-subunit alcohol dehydrogenase family)